MWKVEELILLQDMYYDCSYKYKPRRLPWIPDLCRRLISESEEKRLQTCMWEDIDCKML